MPEHWAMHTRNEKKDEGNGSFFPYVPLTKKSDPEKEGLHLLLTYQIIHLKSIKKKKSMKIYTLQDLKCYFIGENRTPAFLILTLQVLYANHSN